MRYLPCCGYVLMLLVRLVMIMVVASKTSAPIINAFC